MSIEATAEALAPDTFVPDAPVDTPEQDDDAAYDAVWDSLNKEEGEKDEPAPEPEAEADAQPEPEKQVEAPSDLPRELREGWGDIPEKTRDYILQERRGFTQKLTEQGRLIQGISPIRDVLAKAAQENPALAQMKPADIASDLLELSKLSHQFSAKPVETIMGLVKQHGLEQQMQQALAGQPVSQPDQTIRQLQQHVAQLTSHIKQISDPGYIRQNFEAFNTETQVQSEVSQFASTAEHWADVEAFMPTFVEAAKQVKGEGASAKDILSLAYDMAVEAKMPGTKAKQQASIADAIADPEQSERAKKAKSVNVRGTQAGKAREMSEDEALDAAYDRAVSR